MSVNLRKPINTRKHADIGARRRIRTLKGAPIDTRKAV